MASRGINKVTLVGNLGADPEVRYTGSGDMVTTIRVATSEVWKDQENQLQERTEWHRVVFFRGLAEVAGDYLKKGSRVYIEGCLRTQQWEQNGEKRYTTEVIGRELLMLERANEAGESNANAGKQNPAKPQQNGSTSAKATSNQHRQNQTPTVSPTATHAMGNDDDFDDDIPF